METGTVIWIIGVLFTWGITWKSKAGCLFALLMVGVWPYFFGMAIRECLEKLNDIKEEHYKP